jgi:hypothetical protein
MRTLLRSIYAFALAFPCAALGVACSTASSSTTGPETADAAAGGSVPPGGDSGSSDAAVPDGGEDASTDGAAPGTGLCTGSVAGHSLTVAESTMLFRPQSLDPTNPFLLYIMLSSYTGFCPRFNAGDEKPSATTLLLVIQGDDASIHMQPGIFVTGDNKSYTVSAQFHVGDAACNELVPAGSENPKIGGTIEIDSFDENSPMRVTGRFDLHFFGLGGTDDHISGDFDSPQCVVPVKPPTAICYP